jgi:hypothetical protein
MAHDAEARGDAASEKIRTLERINKNLGEQVEYLSELYMMAESERRRLERRYLVVRPFALMKKAIFVFREKRKLRRLARLSGERT